MIPDGTAKTAAKYIYDFNVEFGIPDKLFSDQNLSHESKLFEDLMLFLIIKQLRITSYSSKSNGPTEKLNGAIKLYLTVCTSYMRN